MQKIDQALKEVKTATLWNGDVLLKDIKSEQNWIDLKKGNRHREHYFIIETNDIQ